MMQFNHAKLVIQWVSVGGRNFTGICSTTPQEALDIQSFKLLRRINRLSWTNLEAVEQTES